MSYNFNLAFCGFKIHITGETGFIGFNLPRRHCGFAEKLP
jgi:hypothetical protein